MTNNILATLLDQIKWQRYAEGRYSYNDPLLVTQDKLRQIRDSKAQEDILDSSDFALLRNTLVNSIRKIDGYDYQIDAVSSAQCRQHSLSPLFTAMEYVEGKLKCSSTK